MPEQGVSGINATSRMEAASAARAEEQMQQGREDPAVEFEHTINDGVNDGTHGEVPGPGRPGA